MIEDGLISFLKASPEVSALVGDRVYGPQAPQSVTFPYLTLLRISGPRWRVLRGTDGVAHPRIQITCWGQTYTQVKTLAEEVRKADGGQGGLRLEALKGVMGGQVVQATCLEDERDHDSPPLHEGETGVYATSLDLVIWFEET
jgi:hypothetical protein